MLETKERIVTIAALALVVYTLSLVILSPVLSALQTVKKVPSQGTIRVTAIGVGVYWDYACTFPVSDIGWGTLEPGSSASDTWYIRNEGNAPLTLSLETSNWNPSVASQYITLSWNYGGESISPDAFIRVDLTLAVSASIQGVTDFSFDITVTGTS